MPLSSIISTILVFILLLIGFLYAFKLKNKTLISIFLVQFIILSATLFLGSKKINNLFLFHLDTYIFFIIYSFVFYIYGGVLKKRVLIYSNIINFIFTVTSILYINSLDQFNEKTNMVCALWFMGLSVHYYYKVINSDEILTISTSPSFWYISSIFLYFALNLLLFTTYNSTMYIMVSEHISLWTINDFSAVLLNLLFIVGAHLEYKKSIKLV